LGLYTFSKLSTLQDLAILAQLLSFRQLYTSHCFTHSEAGMKFALLYLIAIVIWLSLAGLVVSEENMFEGKICAKIHTMFTCGKSI